MTSTLTLLPFKQFRSNRYFYLWYDGFYVGLCLALLAVMHFTHHQPLLLHFRWGTLALLLPLACYAQILCSVFIHVCTHKSFPIRFNRLIGELCGMVVLTRFASWEVIHRRHHQFSDDLDNDPHPVVPGFFDFMIKTVVGVEAQLQRIFFELHGGDTADNRRYEKRRALLSYVTNLLLIYTWYRFLGPIAFLALFVPSALVGFVHLVHFNWSTHNAEAKNDFHPVNLDRGFYRIGNKLFFGIYMHGNHHRRPSVLNPATMEETAPARLARAA